MADDVDALFGLPLEEFTQARDALARRLRDAGEREKAGEVASLRKPVLAAWVVNRLVRERRKETKALVAAAETIRAGRKGGEERLRDALEQLMRAARKLLEAEGRESADAVLRDVAATLRTGAAEAPEELAAGRLTRPLEPSGFAAMVGAALPARRESRAARDQRGKRDDARVDNARRAVETARDEARRLGREADAAERDAARLRSEADGAARRLRDAEEALAKLRAR